MSYAVPSVRESAEPPRRLLDRAAAAAYLGVEERTIRSLWETRQIGAVKVGRLVRFTTGDLDAYIEARKIEAVR